MERGFFSGRTSAGAAGSASTWKTWHREPFEQDNGSFLEAVLQKKKSNPQWFAFTALRSGPGDFSLSASDCNCGIFSIDVGKNGCKAETKAKNLKI